LPLLFHHAGETDAGRLLAVVLTERSEKSSRHGLKAETLEGKQRMKMRITVPTFKNESQEADWWASREGRDFVKRRSAETPSDGTKVKGSSLIARLGKKNRK
jgi:hypothetical protein